MPKPTLATVCAKHGITKNQLDAARAKGVNVWNDSQMTAHLASRRHRQKPDAKISGDSLAATARTLEEMQAALAAAQDAATVKILASKIAGMERAAKAQAFRRDLVPIGEVKESIVKIVSAARGEFLKLTSDLPPQLSGKTPPAIQKILRAAIVAVLTRLSNDCDAAY